jgi:hypothetical protein
MVKVAKTYRLEPETLEQLEKLKKHLHDRRQVMAEGLGMKNVKEPKDYETLEFAINFAFETLKKEGYDL